MGRPAKYNTGAIRRGQEIGKQPYVDYTFALCPDCGKARWVELRYYQKGLHKSCEKCAAALRTQKLIAFNKKRGRSLTPKQLNVLVLISLGLANKQVAVRMGIGQRTVGRYCDRIYRKLGVDNRVSAVIKGLQLR